MSKRNEILIGVEKVSLFHGGSPTQGFWVTGEVIYATPNKMVKVNLSVDEAEDLEATIAQWMKNRMGVRIDTALDD